MPNSTITVNGVELEVKASSDTPLLYVLRDELGLNGPKFGCGVAQCGACTVIMNGRAVRSCVTPLSAVKSPVKTIEGIGTAAAPHPVQKAFIAEQAASCGYCASGWVMSSVAILEKNAKITDAQIRDQLSGLKCRCGTHMAILRAVRKAADSMA